MHEQPAVQGCRAVEVQSLLPDVQVARIFPRDRELVSSVNQHLNPLHNVLIYHMLVLPYQLRLKLNFVYNPHLFQEC